MKTGRDDGMEEVLPRRLVLRNALAVGCGLLLPAILIGCDSKKTESAAAAPANAQDTGASASTDSGAASVSPAAPATPGKVPQASVQYQNQPKGVQQCSGCMHFVAETNTCKVVEGEVSPDAWCLLWVQSV